MTWSLSHKDILQQISSVTPVMFLSNMSEEGHLLSSQTVCVLFQISVLKSMLAEPVSVSGLLDIRNET